MQLILERKKEELRILCQDLNVKRLYVFGSVLSERFNDESDIDFLISFADDLSITDYTNNYFTLQYKLRE
jgi:uncharacterized protein